MFTTTGALSSPSNIAAREAEQRSLENLENEKKEAAKRKTSPSRTPSPTSSSSLQAQLEEKLKAVEAAKRAREEKVDADFPSESAKYPIFQQYKELEASVVEKISHVSKEDALLDKACKSDLYSADVFIKAAYYLSNDEENKTVLQGIKDAELTFPASTLKTNISKLEQERKKIEEENALLITKFKKEMITSLEQQEDKSDADIERKLNAEIVTAKKAIIEALQVAATSCYNSLFLNSSKSEADKTADREYFLELFGCVADIHPTKYTLLLYSGFGEVIGKDELLSPDSREASLIKDLESKHDETQKQLQTELVNIASDYKTSIELINADKTYSFLGDPAAKAREKSKLSAEKRKNETLKRIAHNQEVFDIQKAALLNGKKLLASMVKRTDIVDHMVRNNELPELVAIYNKIMTECTKNYPPSGSKGTTSIFSMVNSAVKSAKDKVAKTMKHPASRDFLYTAAKERLGDKYFKCNEHKLELTEAYGAAKKLLQASKFEEKAKELVNASKEELNKLKSTLDKTLDFEIANAVKKAREIQDMAPKVKETLVQEAKEIRAHLYEFMEAWSNKIDEIEKIFESESQIRTTVKGCYEIAEAQINDHVNSGTLKEALNKIVEQFRNEVHALESKVGVNLAKAQAMLAAKDKRSIDQLSKQAQAHLVEARHTLQGSAFEDNGEWGRKYKLYEAQYSALQTSEREFTEKKWVSVEDQLTDRLQVYAAFAAARSELSLSVNELRQKQESLSSLKESINMSVIAVAKKLQKGEPLVEADKNAAEEKYSSLRDESKLLIEKVSANYTKMLAQLKAVQDKYPQRAEHYQKMFDKVNALYQKTLEDDAENSEAINRLKAYYQCPQIKKEMSDLQDNSNHVSKHVNKVLIAHSERVKAFDSATKIAIEQTIAEAEKDLSTADSLYKSGVLALFKGVVKGNKAISKMLAAQYTQAIQEHKGIVDSLDTSYKSAIAAALQAEKDLSLASEQLGKLKKLGELKLKELAASEQFAKVHEQFCSTYDEANKVFEKYSCLSFEQTFLQRTVDLVVKHNEDFDNRSKLIIRTLPDDVKRVQATKNRCIADMRHECEAVHAKLNEMKQALDSVEEPNESKEDSFRESKESTPTLKAKLILIYEREKTKYDQKKAIVDNYDEAFAKMDQTIAAQRKLAEDEGARKVSLAARLRQYLESNAAKFNKELRFKSFFGGKKVTVGTQDIKLQTGLADIYETLQGNEDVSQKLNTLKAKVEKRQKEAQGCFYYFFGRKRNGAVDQLYAALASLDWTKCSLGMLQMALEGALGALPANQTVQQVVEPAVHQPRTTSVR